MTDPLATSGQPVPPEIEQIIAARVAELIEPRIKGFQRLVSDTQRERDDYARQLRETKMASLAPEEQVTYRQSELEAENARLQALIELNELFAQFPDEAPIVRNLMQSDSTMGQLQALREARLAWAPRTDPAAPAGGTPPAPGTVDPNRPSTAAATSSYQGDTPMDDAMSDLLLQGTKGMTLAESNRQRR